MKTVEENGAVVVYNGYYRVGLQPDNGIVTVSALYPIKVEGSFPVSRCEKIKELSLIPYEHLIIQHMVKAAVSYCAANEIQINY